MNCAQFPRDPQFPDPSAYSSLLAYVDEPEIKGLEDKLSALNRSDSFYVEIAKKIKEGNWETLFKETPDVFPLQALQSVKALALSSMAFSTSQLMFNVLQHHEHIKKPVEIVPIFIDKEGTTYRSGDAVRLINETMKLFFPLLFDGIVPASEEKVWTKKQENRFYRILSKMEPCEQRFLLIPITKNHLEMKNGKQFITTNLVFSLGFNHFNTLSRDKTVKWMVPTSGMMEAYQQACYSNTRTIPVYRLTLSTMRGLHETLKEGGRDLIQSFAPLKHLLPAQIDGAEPEYGRGGERIHDNYHQISIARIPLQHRQMFLQFTDIFYEIAESNLEFGYVCEKLIRYNVELEHQYYYESAWNLTFRNAISYLKKGEWPERYDLNLIFCKTINNLLMKGLKMLQKTPLKDKVDFFLKCIAEKMVKYHWDDTVFTPAMDLFGALALLYRAAKGSAASTDPSVSFISL